ncbi:hypothetical protein GCM10009741_32830 [Kribbella lupini]|uniref:Quercetin 2,3-dioxygenase C-terminal cupin domain-containing protein n=1 Tax=Kribbella lupini TaxID=291602 RepID=A0ABN2AX48_9ACTN
MPGPTRDLNIMTRRGRANATVTVLSPGQAALTITKADPLVIVCLDGSATLQTADTSITIGPGDVAELDEPVRTTGDGHLAVIRVETLAPAD